MQDPGLDRTPGRPIARGQESRITAGTGIEPGTDYGFFTDTTLCIGCKACEVACKEWNQLPAEGDGLTGMSYDNTGGLSASTWRHVAFIEQIGADRAPGRPDRWLMMSDVCKHCDPAPCLEACPTGAIFRTEFGTVVVQQDFCDKLADRLVFGYTNVYPCHNLRPCLAKTLASVFVSKGNSARRSKRLAWLKTGVHRKCCANSCRYSQTVTKAARSQTCSPR